jgi:hypothetical protein
MLLQTSSFDWDQTVRSLIGYTISVEVRVFDPRRSTWVTASLTDTSFLS